MKSRSIALVTPALVLFGLAVASEGCVLRSDAPAVEEMIGSAGSALQSFTWSQGQPPITLMSVNDGFCYLTMVQGSYFGDSEWVTLRTPGGYWELSGNSAQQGIAATAQCSRWSDFGAQATHAAPAGWQEFVDPSANVFITSTNMATSQSFCWPTSINGRFDGPGESVSVFGPNLAAGRSNSVLTVTSLVASESWLLGEASCASFGQSGAVRRPSGPIDFTWQDGQSEVPLMNTNDGVCYLSAMSGQFRGSGEALYIAQHDGRWWLGGRNGQPNSMHGGAECIAYAQGIPQPAPPPPPPQTPTYSGGGGSGSGPVQGGHPKPALQ